MLKTTLESCFILKIHETFLCIVHNPRFHVDHSYVTKDLRSYGAPKVKILFKYFSQYFVLFIKRHKSCPVIYK